MLVKFDEFVGVGELSDHDLLGRGGDEILPGGRVSWQGAGLVGENLLDFRDLLPEFEVSLLQVGYRWVSELKERYLNSVVPEELSIIEYNKIITPHTVSIK